jgi:nucleoside-diphosphate-sugar epimerase
VQRVIQEIAPVWSTLFGSNRFLDLLAEPWDLLCHHAAEMENYRSSDFDALAASEKNTHNLRQVLRALANKGCRKIVLTGTVFEPYEGTGDEELRAVSPYGLSKHITYELFRLESRPLGLSLGKFVIPNPFGPYEDLTRFTSYLVQEWSVGRVPSLRTPDYVRDNIHVSLLTLAYRHFCESLGDGPKCCPSGYRETQGAFAERFAAELGGRLGRKFNLGLMPQAEFSEPMVRTNLTPATTLAPDWSEANAWDELAEYFRPFFGS